jgi:hypothetical protein
MFNMDMLFEFVTTILKNHMFKIGLNKIHQNTSKAYNLQSKLQVDKILDFSYFQCSKMCLYTSNFSYYNQNTSNF